MEKGYVCESVYVYQVAGRIKHKQSRTTNRNTFQEKYQWVK